MKKFNRNISTSKKGFSTIEILIAFAVGIIFLTAAMMVAFSDPTLTRQISIDSGQVAALDATLDNGGLNQASNKIGNMTANLMGAWNSTFSNVTGFFDDTPRVISIAPCLKEITNETSWSSLNSRDRQITFGTAVSNFDIAEALGQGGCDPTPPGDWDNPENTGWSITPSEFTGQGTDIDTAKIDGGEYAVITGEINGVNKPDLIVVDISDPENLTSVSQIDLVPKGYGKVVVAGHYAYVTQNDTLNHLQVIDLSDPENPTRVGQISIPQTTTAIPRSLFYYDEKIYLGTQYLACPPTCASLQNNEFHIFDVSSPTNPQHLASLNIDHNINDIYIQGDYAYLATSDNSGEMMMVNISNPSSLVHPDTSGLKYNPSGNQDGTSIYVIDQYAYLGRQRTTGSDSDFIKINISNPNSPTPEKWRRLGLNPNTAVTDVVVQGRMAFLITSDSNSTFQAWDIRTGSGTQIVPTSSCSNILNLSVSRSLENQATLNIIRDNPNACS
jgi:hypothetical protein